MAEIHQQMKQKVQNKIEVYNIILDRCYKKIRESIKKNYTYCVFQVPDFIYGRPLYDSVHCTQYIHRKLIECSYKINFVNQTTIIVQWTVPKINWEEIDPPVYLSLPEPDPPIRNSSNDFAFDSKVRMDRNDIDSILMDSNIGATASQQQHRFPSLSNLSLSNPTLKSPFQMEIVDNKVNSSVQPQRPNLNSLLSRPNIHSMSNPNQNSYQNSNAIHTLNPSIQIPPTPAPIAKTAKNYPIKRVIDFY